MADLEKPALDDSCAQSTHGTATPSNFSVLEDKEKAIEDVDQKSVEELERVESSLYPSSRKLIGILIGVGLSIFLVALDMTIVATAIPRITDQFKSLEDVGWYGSGFFLTFASFQSMWGKAYKHVDVLHLVAATANNFQVLGPQVGVYGMHRHIRDWQLDLCGGRFKYNAHCGSSNSWWWRGRNRIRIVSAMCWC